MPVKLNFSALPADMRQAITDALHALPSEPSEQDISRIARDVLAPLTTAIVRERADQLASANRRAAQTIAATYYSFFAPDDQPREEVVGRDELGRELIDWVFPTPVHVPHNELEMFAKEHRLNVDQLRAVGMGELEQVKGWTRSNEQGGMCFGHPYTPPRPVEPPVSDEYLIRVVPKTYRVSDGSSPRDTTPFRPKGR